MVLQRRESGRLKRMKEAAARVTSERESGVGGALAAIDQ
jgi:hypothetical protein